MKKEIVPSRTPSEVADGRRQWVWHPFAFALFPLFSLYASNAAEIPLPTLIRPALGLVLLTFLVFLGARALLRNGFKAALIASLFLAWLFSYGHVLETIRVSSGWTSPFGRNLILMPTWSLWLGVLVWMIWRSRRDFKSLNSLLGALSLACLSVAIAQGAWNLGKYQREVAASVSDAGAIAGTSNVASNVAPGAPDVYYVLLDAYGRADRLREFYGYDNTPFIDALRKRGFFVANRSQSNYSQTSLSLSSSLSFSYHEDALVKRKRNSTDRSALFRKIRQNRAARFLQTRGYDVVSITSGMIWVVPAGDVQVRNAYETVANIEQLLLNSTFFGAVFTSHVFRYDQSRRSLDYAIDELPVVAKERKPKPRFVFAHILSPHPPFVWDAQGGPINEDRPYNQGEFVREFDTATRAQYGRRYSGQVTALNAKVLRAIDGILANSRVPPVIILQGDHGPSTGHPTNRASDIPIRSAVLNAFYLPPASSTKPLRANQRPYDSISPVNNFRVVFNRTFETDFPLLPDRSYFSTWFKPFQFVDATEKPATPRKSPPKAIPPAPAR